MIFLPSAWKAKVYCISSSWGHLLFLASLFFLVLFFQFPKYVPVSDGGWHHVAVTRSGVNGTLTLISNGLIGNKREAYGVGAFLSNYGHVTLGYTDKSGSGFHGKLTRVHVWDRVLSLPTVQQQVQLCRAEPILFPGKCITNHHVFEEQYKGVGTEQSLYHCVRVQNSGARCVPNFSCVFPKFSRYLIIIF